MHSKNVLQYLSSTASSSFFSDRKIVNDSHPNIAKKTVLRQRSITATENWASPHRKLKERTHLQHSLHEDDILVQGQEEILYNKLTLTDASVFRGSIQGTITMN